MDNPFKPEDKVITKFIDTEVEALITQVYNREVQVRTPDKILRWRTMYTVRYPGAAFILKPPRIGQTAAPLPALPPDPAIAPAITVPPASPEPIPPVPEPVVQPAVLSPAEVLPTEPVPAQEEELAIVAPSAIKGFPITTCGLEETEELKYAKSKRKRRSKR